MQINVRPANINEEAFVNEKAQDLVLRLSRAKAQKLQSEFSQDFIIAADTVVLLDGKILEKPINSTQNKDFINMLSGKTHQVFGGHTIIYKDKTKTRLVTTDVIFRNLNEHEVNWYVNTLEGMDKAGGYGIQGKGAALVSEIRGCYFNVMGLSVSTILQMAQEIGVELV